MTRIGLALSGGGFRAALYHLGVIRFLRDAGVLSKISHITAVSGGSVTGAHLGLNWDKYCGTDEEFDQAAAEVIRLTQMDVRNKIVRRYPLASLLNLLRKFCWLGQSRKLTRAGLLEWYYEKHLYGDTSLAQLPATPQTHILATNLNEGSICSFNHNGLLQQQRGQSNKELFEQIHFGLATVPMAVAASSAFPGFFPPLELTGWDVGTAEGEFNRQAFTDGGVFDYLGLRMFRYIEQTWILDKEPLVPGEDKFEGILVSDAGKAFHVAPDARPEGLIRTAVRTSDILMDRVYQLELEAFKKSSDIIFFPITQVVDRDSDPHALDPEIQRQTARIRTDLDRFSDLEVSSLIQHGYCVARESCREHSLFKGNIPSDPPWDPMAEAEGATTVQSDTAADPNQTLQDARRLRHSSNLRIWSTLLHFRDWPTYVWLLLVALILLSWPYAIYDANKQARQQQLVLTAIAEMSPVYRDILDMLNEGPEPLPEPTPFVEVDTMEPPDYSGFNAVSDTRIFDLRRWKDLENLRPKMTMHLRLRIQRLAMGEDNSHLRFQAETVDDNISFLCKTGSIDSTLSRMKTKNGKYKWEADLDFSRIPLKSEVEVLIEGASITERVQNVPGEGRFSFSLLANTGLMQIWILMPPGHQYDYFEIIGYPIGSPEQAVVVNPESKVEMPIGAIATFRLVNPQHGWRYECRWKWSE